MKYKRILLLVMLCSGVAIQLQAQHTFFASTGFGMATLSQNSENRRVNVLRGLSFTGGYAYRFLDVIEVNAAYSLYQLNVSSNQGSYSGWFASSFSSTQLNANNMLLGINIFGPNDVFYFKIGYGLGYLQHPNYEYSFYYQFFDFSTRTNVDVLYYEYFAARNSFGNGWTMGSGVNFNLFPRCKLTLDFDYYFMRTRSQITYETLNNNVYREQTISEDMKYNLFSAKAGIKYYLK